MMRRKYLGYAGLLLLLIIVGFIIRTLLAAGVFKTIQPHHDQEAIMLDLPVAGPEDITIDSAGLAFISADDRRTNLSGKGHVRGAIFVLDLTDSSRNLRDVTPASLQDFHPHGISRWVSPEGRIFLFAISHLHDPKVNAIERFEWRNDSLVHLETITDSELIISPNDLVAVGERSFYVTNDHGYPDPGLGRTLEEYLVRAVSNVCWFDGKSTRQVAGDIAYANGINLSRDGSRVYVTSCTGGSLLIYRRLPEGDLEPEREVSLGTGLDNIEIDSGGDLWIGSHPQLLKFAANARDAANPSPAQVLRVSVEKDFAAEEVLLTDGTRFSGSSVAAVWKDWLLVGAVFEPRLMMLRRNH